MNPAVKYEHFITPEWAARAILDVEPLDELVVDPCCGTGVLANVAFDLARWTHCIDIRDWGYPYQHDTLNFLQLRDPWFSAHRFTIFMNPPFSLACEFVDKSFEIGASKVICFQRFAWWEAQKRREFWQRRPPNRVWICGDRAVCWRHDLPQDADGNRYDPETGRKLSSAPTAHAWFVWDINDPVEYGETKLAHIWR